MSRPKLFMILVGCTPQNRHTEQHDVFFGIADSLAGLKQDIIDFWPEANGKIHIDAWREVNYVEGYRIEIMSAKQTGLPANSEKLFFINLGGYKENEFEEFHYKILTVATNKGLAIQQSKNTTFYRHAGFKGAESHIDDKYGIDVDDIFDIEDILPKTAKEKYKIAISKEDNGAEDHTHLGYTILNKLTAV